MSEDENGRNLPHKITISEKELLCILKVMDESGWDYAGYRRDGMEVEREIFKKLSEFNALLPIGNKEFALEARMARPI